MARSHCVTGSSSDEHRNCQLAAKLRSNPCCIDPKSRDKILDVLQRFGSGGITFVYQQTLPSDPNHITCAEVSNVWSFLTNKVVISDAAMNGQCRCPLAGTILHEATHLTWGNYFGPAPENLAIHYPVNRLPPWLLIRDSSWGCLRKTETLTSWPTSCTWPIAHAVQLQSWLDSLPTSSAVFD